MTGHAPPPWTTHYSTACPDLINWVCDADGDSVRLVGIGITATTKATRATAMVVRSVNAHEPMLEALREAELQIVYLQEKFGGTGSGEAALTKIRGAIAAAEGR